MQPILGCSQVDEGDVLHDAHDAALSGVVLWKEEIEDDKVADR